MMFYIIKRYKLIKFFIYFITINTVIYFPFGLGTVLDFLGEDTSGLGGFAGFIYYPILFIVLSMLFLHSFFEEIGFLIKDIKLYKNKNFFYHFFTSHIFYHAFLLSMFIIIAILNKIL